MLRRRHFAQTQTLRETKRRQTPHEARRPRGYSPGSIPSGTKSYGRRRRRLMRSSFSAFLSALCDSSVNRPCPYQEVEPAGADLSFRVCVPKFRAEISRRRLSPLYIRNQPTARQTHGNLISGRNLFRAPHHVPGRIINNRISAIQYSQRASFFELQHQPLESLPLRDKKSVNS